MDQLPRLGKRELICLLLFTCNYVVFVWRGFLFLWVLGMGYVILLWHSLSLPYNYFILNQLIHEKPVFCIFLWPLYSDIISFINHYCAGGGGGGGGVSNKHCLLPSFHFFFVSVG